MESMGSTDNPAAGKQSKDRAIPACPHFGPCGGCQLQDIAYPAQLTLKSDRLRALLTPTGIVLPELQLHPSPPFAYRNRIRLTLAQTDNQLRAGYLCNETTLCGGAVISTAGGAFPAEVERPPHFSSLAAKTAPSFLPITQCPIAAPVLWHTTEAVLALANPRPAPWLNAADQLELFAVADESRLQLTLSLRAKKPPTILATEFTAFCEQLRTQIPGLAGAAIALLPPASKDRSRRTEIARPGPTWGAPGLNYSVAPQPATYWVPRGAFFQANRFLLPELLRLVTHGRSGNSVWDLYAGVGLFSRPLAAQFDEVVSVEIAEPAASALASTKLPNLRAVKATTLDFLRANVIQRERPDLVVLDPPRTGAGPEVCTLLARIAAPTLIYVSCSPQTLPTDLAILIASGYTVAELHLLDLFPQTTHIETIVILHR
jgi:23S rRNA (uracil1939-C5)-methyltransferase